MFLIFDKGKAVVKQGRKIVAKVYDRATFYAAHNIPAQFSPEYPYGLEIPAVGFRECQTLEEVQHFISKYTA